MTYIFPREADKWAEGDLAYCIRPCRSSRPSVERGRVYRVAEAMKPENIGHHGLKLAGIDTGEAWGFLSNRFIKVGPAGGRLATIAKATEYTSSHYWPAIPAVDRLALRIEARRAKTRNG